MEMKEKEGEFETNLKKLVAVLGGDSVFKKSKLPKDSISTLVTQLVEERKQETLTNFKTKAKDLLDKKIEFDKEVKKLKEDFEKNIETKKKEFSNKMKELFQMVENIEEIEKSYYDSLKETSEDK